MAVTLRFQSTGTVPSNSRPVQMNGPSLTIGRGEENDLVLPDPDRMISKRHCALEDHGGSIVVFDFSTNGTFLNYGKVPLGKAPTPVNDGDILSLGTYELMVEIRETRVEKTSAAVLPHLDDGPIPYGNAGTLGTCLDPLDGSSEMDFLDELLGDGAAPSGPSRVLRPRLGDDGLLPPLDPDELLAPVPQSTLTTTPAHSPVIEDSFRVPELQSPGAGIPDDWDDHLLPTDSSAGNPLFDDPFGSMAEETTREEREVEAGLAHSSADAAADVDRLPQIDDSPFVTRPPHLSIPEAVKVPEPGPQANEGAARAFLKAAGGEHLAIADAELITTLSRMGHVLRIMIQGLREVLMTRSSIKSEFRISQTMISAGGNNPLKFSVSAEQAVEAMLKPTTRGYLDPVEAAEQALRDVKAHEVAMITGMEAALAGILQRLDPAVLEATIETTGGFGSMLKGRKARYWEAYENIYAEIAEQAKNDFNELFAREFARAYQDQLERLK